MENKKIAISVEQQFGEVIDIILRHKSRASKAVNEELLGKQGRNATIGIYSVTAT